jgi:hypothetical protein
MSIASGRAWMAAGTGLGNIGRLLVEQEERERERQRQEAAEARYAEQMTYSRGRDAAGDAIAAMDRQRQEAQSAEQTGVNYVPVTSNARKVLSGTTTVEPTSLPNIGQIALGGAKETRTPGYYKTEPSAPERVRAATAATNAAELRAAETEMAGHLAAPYGSRIPRGLGVEATNEIGRSFAKARLTRTGGGGVPSGPAGARQLVPLVQGQVNDAEQARKVAADEFSWFRARPEGITPAAVPTFVADSAAAAGALRGAEGLVGEFTARRDSLVNAAMGGSPPTPAPNPRTIGPPTPARPAAPAATPAPQFTPDQARTRARALQAEGKTPQQIRDQMRAEGFNVTLGGR